MLLQQVDIDLALAQTEKDQVMMELTNFVTAYFFFYRYNAQCKFL